MLILFFFLFQLPYQDMGATSSIALKLDWF